MSRTATIERITKETKIKLSLTVDGSGSATICTSVPFLDHMLNLFARNGIFDLDVEACGDIDIDFHHTVEDIGIVIVKTLAMALGEKRGINRYCNAVIPMDETLASCAIDLSGRPYLVLTAEYSNDRVGDFDTALVEEFFRAVAFNAGMTLHLRCEYGSNDHHKIEAMFKAFARSLRMAVAIDPDFADQIPSTKGVLE